MAQDEKRHVTNDGRERDGGAAGSASDASMIGTTAYLFFGPTIWALHLFAMYGPQSLFCARGLPEAVAPTVAGATLLCVLPLLWAIVAPHSLARLLRAGGRSGRQGSFLAGVTRLLSVLSLFGVLAGGATLFVLPACSGLR